MTQGEVKLFEAEVVLFQSKPEKELKAEEIEQEAVEVKMRTLKIDVDKRFARLRKSIRKRSAGIF